MKTETNNTGNQEKETEMKANERIAVLLKERKGINAEFNTRITWRGTEQHAMVRRLQNVEQEIDLLTPGENVMRCPW